MLARWPSDQIISAAIIGGCSLTATLISAYINSRRAAAAQATGKRSRSKPPGRSRYVALFVAGLAAGMIGYRFGAPALGIAGVGVPGPVVAAEAARPTPYRDRAAPDDRSDPAAPTPPDATPPASPPLSTWLRADGLRIHYRYADRLPGACDGRVAAFGNWVDGRRGLAVECLDDGWLVLDLTEPTKAGRLTRNVTHCFAIRGWDGSWAQHDRVPSPGLERVAIASKAGTWGGPPLGFRVVRADGVDRIEFTNAYPRLDC